MYKLSKRAPTASTTKQNSFKFVSWVSRLGSWRKAVTLLLGSSESMTTVAFLIKFYLCSYQQTSEKERGGGRQRKEMRVLCRPKNTHTKFGAGSCLPEAFYVWTPQYVNESISEAVPFRTDNYCVYTEGVTYRHCQTTKTTAVDGRTKLSNYITASLASAPLSPPPPFIFQFSGQFNT